MLYLQIFQMAAAIELDGQESFMTVKIEDIFSGWMLPAEFYIFKSAVA